ncbi:hypothetical protein P5G65_14460 [Paenibacillus chondroitinus]|uniref:Glycosyltransferase 2-like domain-containing protein n=1 Tax=Paenibacillus chondroitinus TaxID=59842 RepID=A0ABU6DBI1_9BACL|nr:MULTISPECIES: hypothetical protein [Paenibacillus]MCY9660494.1 hypothetical protein [Paenibacillus anseongense]MEB4795105.1 hypothetical protein [Paenibacillus chondroitinus]
MWIGLLWILGCYGISIAVLHLLFGARKGRKKKPAKVLLVTKNNQNQIEWYIRSLFFFSGLKGYEVTATIYDEGSSDDTRQIIERLSHTHLLDLRYQMDFDAVDQFRSQHEGESVVVVHLSNREDLVKIPVG